MKQPTLTVRQRIWNYLRMQRGRSAIRSLDGLRGIAILLVLGRHAVRPFHSTDHATLQWGGWDPLTPLVNGWVGVDLFFVLSGFLVVHHLLTRGDGKITSLAVREYLVKRFLRIVPAYYTFLLIVAAGLIPCYQFSRVDLPHQIVQHLLFLQDYCGAHIVVAFWSLGVEEKFYFAAPFLVLLLLKMPQPGARVRLLVLMMAIPTSLRWLTYFSHPWIQSYTELFWTLRSPFHLAVDALLLGALCALLLHHRHEFRWLQAPALPTALLWTGGWIIAVLLLARPLLDRPNWFNSTLLFPSLAVGFACILLALVLEPKRPRPLLNSRCLFFFSKISYSLYLVHMVFVESVLVLLQQADWFPRLSLGGQLLVYLPVYAAISIAAALLLHYAVEKPFLIVKDRFRLTPAGDSQLARPSAPVLGRS